MDLEPNSKTHLKTGWAQRSSSRVGSGRERDVRGKREMWEVRETGDCNDASAHYCYLLLRFFFFFLFFSVNKNKKMNLWIDNDVPIILCGYNMILPQFPFLLPTNLPDLHFGSISWRQKAWMVSDSVDIW